MVREGEEATVILLLVEALKIKIIKYNQNKCNIYNMQYCRWTFLFRLFLFRELFFHIFFSSIILHRFLFIQVIFCNNKKRLFTPT